MSQPSGTRMRDCPICGNRYLRTNWMHRHDGEHVTMPNGRNLILNDTHLKACYRKLHKEPPHHAAE